MGYDLITEGTEVLHVIEGESIWSGAARVAAILYCGSDILSGERRGSRIEWMCTEETPFYTTNHRLR